MLMTRFAKSGGMATSLRNPPITTSCTPAWRHGPKISAEYASLDFVFFSATSVAMPAALANSNPFAAGLLEITRRISTGNSRLSRSAIRLRRVVPPPEISTAMGSGFVIPNPGMNHRDTEAQRGEKAEEH